MQASDQSHLPADLLTGADLGGGDDADSDLSQPDESASGDSMDDGSGALDNEEQEDEDAALDDVVTAKGNHKRREDKKLLPTEDKYVPLSLSLLLYAWLEQHLYLKLRAARAHCVFPES